MAFALGAIDEPTLLTLEAKANDFFSHSQIKTLWSTGKPVSLETSKHPQRQPEGNNTPTPI